jgi:hypothetical protein
MSFASVRRAALALLTLAIAACSLSPVYTSHLYVRPTLPMIASKIERPLYVVLDPAQVPDQYTIPEGAIKELKIYEIHDFVRRDLRGTLATYFAHVHVVAPGAPIPDGALVALVQIQGFALDAETGPLQLTYMLGANGKPGPMLMPSVSAHGRMEWAFAIRVPGERDYAFSFSDSAISTTALTASYDSPEVMASTYSVALDHLLERLGQPDVLARLDQQRSQNSSPMPSQPSTSIAGSPSGASLPTQVPNGPR